MTGARTVAGKELRELLLAEGRPQVQLAIAGVIDVAAGILIPLGLANLMYHEVGLWPTIGMLCMAILGLLGFMGFVGPMATVGDAFAGERERHTLETLLASPLSDGAILGGKMLAQYAVVLAHVVLVAVVSALTSTILLGPAGLTVLAVGLVGGALVAGVTSSLVIGAGFLLSLKAPTVRKAQERLTWILFPVFLLPAFGPGLVSSGGGPLPLLLVGIAGPAVLVAASIVFNAVVVARFRRDRLIGLG